MGGIQCSDPLLERHGLGILGHGANRDDIWRRGVVRCVESIASAGRLDTVT